MQDIIITILIAIAALINFTPLIGVISARKLEALYGEDMSGQDMAIYMRHRAVLFGLLGGFLFYAAFTPAEQPAAFVIGLISMVSFLIIACLERPYSVGVRKIVRADVVGIVCLLGAALLYYLK